MSGGSLDYEFGRIEDLADTIEHRARKPLHRAFAAHLRKVAKAAHDLEWVWSGDSSDGDEDGAIEACLSPGAPLEQTIEDAERAVVELQNELARTKELKEYSTRTEHGCLCNVFKGAFIGVVDDTPRREGQP